MIPLRSDVTAMVASLLGDTQTSTPALYTAAFQAPHLNIAFQELIGELDNIGAERVQAEGYYLLPAYTGLFVPATGGFTNFEQPNEIHERGSAANYAISAVTPGTGTCAVTCAALPASVITGAQVDINNPGGISADINDTWTITVSNPPTNTQIVLNGCVATGTYTTGGNVIYSTEQWSGALDPKLDTDDFPTAPQSALGMYCWQKGALKFPACSTARELKIQYQISGALPVISSPNAADSMGVDGSLMFLANRTAQYCGKSKGNPTWQELQKSADYFLNWILQGVTREMQENEVVAAAPFRLPRNVSGRTVFW